MLNIVTAYTRKENIPIIYSSIFNQTDNFNWYIIEGSNTNLGNPDYEFIKNDSRVKYYKIETKYTFGYEQRNFFMKNIKCEDDDWCYFLDDDNTITWDLIDVTNNEELTTDIILFSQKVGLSEKIRLYGYEDRLTLGNCDIGSFAIRYRVAKNTEINDYIRNGDGHYCEYLNSLKGTHNIKFYPDKFVRYNTLSLRYND
jgi:hypothetical protein